MLSGSQRGNGTEVSLFDPKKNHWSEGPDLNNARYSHYTCCLARHVFVMGGMTHSYKYEGSIEAWNVESGHEWVIVLENDDLVRRYNAACVAISHN